MNKNIRQITAITLVLALVVGCFAALPWTANAAPEPVPGNPGWKAEYSKNANKGIQLPTLWDRGDASGDKIPSNAHSADYPGLYFYWDDKQKDDGVLLVNEDVFKYFQDDYTYKLPGPNFKKDATDFKTITFAKGDPGFVLTAKNSNNYWGYKIAKSTGKVIDTVNGKDIYAYAIPKQIQYINDKGKTTTEDVKNINMVFIDGQYKDAWFVIGKRWLNEVGRDWGTGDHNFDFSGMFTESKAYPSLWEKLSFKNGYELGMNKVPINNYNEAMNGKKITVTENPIPGFEEISGGTSKTITVHSNTLPTVLFKNQKQWADIIIEKIWKDADGNEITDEAQLAKLTAKFTINGKAAELGANKVKEGAYIVRETWCTEGYNLISINGKKVTDDVIIDKNGINVEVNAGKTETVKFVNKDPAPPIGRQTFEKWVENADGIKVRIDVWEPNGDYTIADLCAGITFKLYTEHAYMAKDFSNPVATATLNEHGVADFTTDLRSRFVGNTFEEGYYYIVEELSDLAETVFTKPTDGILVYITRSSIVDKANFDYDSKYTIVNGYNSPKHTAGLGYPGLNNGGDLFYIGVKNSETGDEFASFCAHGGSKNFAGESGQGCSGYVVIFKPGMGDLENPEMDKAYYNILAALNWIQDEVGDLRLTNGPYGLVTTQRVVAQTVIWALLGNIDVTSEAFQNTNLTSEEMEYVLNALDAANEGYVGEITNLVYMVCEHHHEFETCQPQLVPIYGTTQFVNKLRDNPSFDVSFTKTKYGGVWAVEADEFAFDLFKIVDGTEVYVETCTTAAGGVVTAKGLTSGDYVFREVWAYAIGTGNDDSYALVWKPIYPDNDADGLYFTIAVNGVVTWAGYDGDDKPTVDNVFYCKHSVVWSADYYYGMQTKEKIRLPDGSWINIFAEGNTYCPHTGTLTVLTTVPATCYNGGYTIAYCSGGCDVTTVFGVTPSLVHNYVLESGYWPYDSDKGEYVHAGDWYRCTLCGATECRLF